MKRLFVAMAIGILGLLCLTACGDGKGNENSTALAETAVKQAVIRFQEGDSEYILRILGLHQAPFVTNCSEEQIDRLAATMFSELDGEIMSSEKKNDNTVIVETKLTTTDYSKADKMLTPELSKRVLQALFADKTEMSVLTEESLQVLEDTIASCGEKTEIILPITVKKQGGGWEVLGTEELLDALCGGLYSKLFAIIE